MLGQHTDNLTVPWTDAWALSRIRDLTPPQPALHPSLTKGAMAGEGGGGSRAREGPKMHLSKRSLLRHMESPV